MRRSPNGALKKGFPPLCQHPANGCQPRARQIAARSVLVALVLGLSTAFAPRAAAAQESAVFRGLDLEAKGKFREAAVAFREAMAGTADPQHATQAMLGLERAYAELGWSDSLI